MQSGQRQERGVRLAGSHVQLSCHYDVGFLRKIDQCAFATGTAGEPDLLCGVNAWHVGQTGAEWLQTAGVFGKLKC